MKSVVVEASTVAKAIQAAWLKADRPEEFFIRVLQEHSSGFLGFGAQKAKVVFFFKNSQKSDSLFPVVLKQKEYTNFFGNAQLKAPAQLNVVDHELNKNVVLGGQHKKKHNNQQQNHAQGHSKDSAQQVNKSAQKHNEHAASSAAHKPVQNHGHKQNNNVQQQAPKQLSVEKMLANDAAINKVLQAAPKKHATQQLAPKKAGEQKNPAHKDIVKDVANALKKVQSQKIVANVSSSHDTKRAARVSDDKNIIKADDATVKAVEQFTAKKPMPKSTTKFESYEDFINSKTGIPAEKESVAAPVITKSSIVDEIESLHKILDSNKTAEAPVQKFEQAASQEVVQEHVAQPVVTKPVALRAPLKFKRRPLSTDKTEVVAQTVAAPADVIQEKSDEIVQTPDFGSEQK